MKANQRQICVRYNNVNFSNNRVWQMMRVMFQNYGIEFVFIRVAIYQNQAFWLIAHMLVSYTVMIYTHTHQTASSLFSIFKLISD